VNAPRRFDLVDDLIALIGADGYLRLAEAMGGAMFHVPRQPGPDHPITLAIGADAAALVAANFHGLKITLPITEYRRRAIAALAAQGLSGDVIARQLRLPRSTVYRELTRRPDTRQLALFSTD
jgi:hypothetical protein